jgi:hypothetical protein
LAEIAPRAGGAGRQAGASSGWGAACQGGFARSLPPPRDTLNREDDAETR